MTERAPCVASTPRNLWAWPGSLAAVAVLCGIVFRLIWPEDIEFKFDERFTFEGVAAILNGAPWPWVGMPTSLGPPNPGMTVWVFAGLGGLAGVKTAPELARAVQWLNVLALLAFVAFACTALARQARERWLCAAALWAVNPVAIVFERKIWPPSVLPLASVAFMACWWHRRHFAMSLLCGVLLALMTQIHLGVVFLAAALFAWTWLYDGRSFRWPAWIAGGALGSLPALPWLFEVMQRTGEAAVRFRVPVPHYFVRWVTQPFGFGIEYALGRADFLDYLSSPSIAGHTTYAMALAHAVLAAIFVVVVARAVSTMLAERPPLRTLLLGAEPETVLINAMLWGYGGLITLAMLVGLGSNRHYLIVATPVIMLWGVRLIWAGDRVGRRTGTRAWARPIITALCLAQAVASAGLLHYIHRTEIIRGEYGATWRAQQPGFVPSRLAGTR